MELYDLFNERYMQDNVAIEINNNEDFMPLAYNILTNDKKEIFINSIKLKVNGKITLVYLTNENVSLAEILPELNESRLGRIIIDLLRKAEEFAEYGFLEQESLITNFNRIYVDVNTLKIRYIYIPVHVKATVIEKNVTVEERIRETLVQYLRMAYPGDNENKRIIRCRKLLENREIKGRELQIELEKLFRLSWNEIIPQGNEKTGMVLYLNNSKTRHNIVIERESLIIGKQSPSPKGIIKNDKEVSRKHCQIIFENGDYYIMDLRSTNGTKVNGKRLTPMKQMKLQSGDRIMIAGQVFDAKIK